jgi:hypothetical protein
MMRRISELPVVLTCFAYRQEYFEEMEGMLRTIKEHHAGWPVVVGRGPVPGYSEPTLEVESPRGKSYWTLPVALNLDASDEDWRKITRMKGWWMSRVWHEYGDLIGGGQKRVVWADADARFNGPLDIELDSRLEVISGPWGNDVMGEGLCGGILIFQGAREGKVESIINQWSRQCLSQIQNLPDDVVSWLDSDQEVLNKVLRNHPESDGDYVLLKLERDKYCGFATEDDTETLGALVDQWRASSIPGRAHFPYLLNARMLLGEGVEIGVEQGYFSEIILSRWTGRRLYSIDPWRKFPDENYRDTANVSDEQQDFRYAETADRLRRFGDRSSILRMTSREAASRFRDKQLDFAYIDAQHHYEAVKEDIDLWYSKIREGGILAGHDYWDGSNEGGLFGVKSAVDEFAHDNKLRLVVSREVWPPWRSWFFLLK